MGVLSVLLVSGIIQDGWAHAHGMVDQSFLTPWHAVLYSMMAANGIVLGTLAVRNKMRGYAATRALPYGYTLALVGVVLFAAGGVGDLAWHTVFGIEADINALLSPSHLVLGFAAFLILSGPLRSIAFQYDRATAGWRKLGPMVLALLAILTTLGFFLAYAQPIEDGITTVAVQPDRNGPVLASLYSVAIDGAAETHLVLPPHLDVWGLSASPGGSSVVYRAQAPRTTANGAILPSDLYVARRDGSGARRITHSGMHDTQPAWSPDGKWIAYVSIPAGTSGDYALRIVHPDGSGVRTLATGSLVEEPAWSPDSSAIAYGSRKNVTETIATVDLASGLKKWLPIEGSEPAWGLAGLYFHANDGSLRLAQLDGSHSTVVVPSGLGASTLALSPDARHVAFVAPSGGGAQVFVAGADGSHASNVSQLAGFDAQHPAWLDDRHVVFSASAHGPPEHSGIGSGLGVAANILESVLLAGVLLVAVRRWRVPFGAFTLILALFALAMAAQTDYYYDAIPALITGLCADVAIVFLRDRVRQGIGFYAFAALLPGVFAALYFAATVYAGGGTSWTPDMLLGTPIICACAGLLVAFCYEPPLPEAKPA